MQNSNSLNMTSPEHFCSSGFGALASDTSQLGLRPCECTISERPLASLTFCLSNRKRTKQLKAFLGSSLKAHLHDATSRMRLSFWRMKTTADATISVDQLTAKFKTWQLYTQLLEYIRQGKNRIRLVASCRWALIQSNQCLFC